MNILLLIIAIFLIAVLFYFWKKNKAKAIKDEGDKPPDDIYPLY
jgi:hypothetical protein